MSRKIDDGMTAAQRYEAGKKGRQTRRRWRVRNRERIVEYVRRWRRGEVGTPMEDRR